MPPRWKKRRRSGWNVSLGRRARRLTAYEAHAFRKWLSKYMGTLVNKLNS